MTERSTTPDLVELSRRQVDAGEPFRARAARPTSDSLGSEDEIEPASAGSIFGGDYETARAAACGLAEQLGTAVDVR